ANRQEVADSRDTGLLIVVRTVVGQQSFAQVVLRPADAMQDGTDVLKPFMGGLERFYGAARFLLDAQATAIAKRISQTPVPNGGFEANPLLSAPDLVARVASRLNLDESAATAYLQVLTLAEPTTRNLAAWNAWRPKQLTGSLTELVE